MQLRAHHTELCLFPIKLRLAWEKWLDAPAHTSKADQITEICMTMCLPNDLAITYLLVTRDKTYLPTERMAGCVGSIHFWKVPILLIRVKQGALLPAAYCHIGVQPFMNIQKKVSIIHIQYFIWRNIMKTFFLFLKKIKIKKIGMSN